MPFMKESWPPLLRGSSHRELLYSTVQPLPRPYSSLKQGSFNMTVVGGWLVCASLHVEFAEQILSIFLLLLVSPPLPLPSPSPLSPTPSSPHPCRQAPDTRPSSPPAEGGYPSSPPLHPDGSHARYPGDISQLPWPHLPTAGRLHPPSQETGTQITL